MDPRVQVTLLLLEANNGNSHAIDQLIPIVDDELRRLAARYVRDERSALTLQDPSGKVWSTRLVDHRSPLAALNGENSRAKSRMSVKIARRTGAICCGRVFDPLAPSSWAGV